MSKRKQSQKREERRADQVEVNLLAESEGGGRVLAKARRGCGLPFLGGSVLVLVFEAVRAGLG